MRVHSLIRSKNAESRSLVLTPTLPIPLFFLLHALYRACILTKPHHRTLSTAHGEAERSRGIQTSEEPYVYNSPYAPFSIIANAIEHSIDLTGRLTAIESILAFGKKKTKIGFPRFRGKERESVCVFWDRLN